MSTDGVALQLWCEHWCHRCHQVDEVLARKGYAGAPGCPIKALALSGTVPDELEPASYRQPEAKNRWRCIKYRDRPPVYKAPKAAPEGEQGEMFDGDEVLPAPRLLVPLDGWPDYRAQREASHDTT
jgi:hypothetical protein